MIVYDLVLLRYVSIPMFFPDESKAFADAKLLSKLPSQTVQTTCTKVQTTMHFIEGCTTMHRTSEKKLLSKIASAKIAPAKMQRKFPNRGKMAPEPNHESIDD